MISRGVLIQTSHNISFSHTDTDLVQVMNAYEGTFKVISELVTDRQASDKFSDLPKINPVFTVR